LLKAKLNQFDWFRRDADIVDALEFQFGKPEEMELGAPMLLQLGLRIDPPAKVGRSGFPRCAKSKFHRSGDRFR
jgi:hypothetical protein